jgi:hypothetical protein
MYEALQRWTLKTLLAIGALAAVVTAVLIVTIPWTAPILADLLGR